MKYRGGAASESKQSRGLVRRGKALRRKVLSERAVGEVREVGAQMEMVCKWKLGQSPHHFPSSSCYVRDLNEGCTTRG